MTLFPRNNMKYCGDNEECTEPHAIHPCCYLFPSIIRKTVEKGATHNGRNNEELRRQKAVVKSLLTANVATTDSTATAGQIILQYAI